MAKQIETPFSKLIVKAMLDEEFRKKLNENPVATSEKEGIKITPEESEAIKKLKLEDWQEITTSELQQRLKDIDELAAIKIGSVWVDG